MSEDELKQAEAVDASRRFKDDMEALCERHGVHSLCAVWAQNSEEDRGKDEDALVIWIACLGCPGCGGAALADGVAELPAGWRVSFVERLVDRFLKRTETEVVDVATEAPSVH